jgi:hypothetical protein
VADAVTATVVADAAPVARLPITDVTRFATVADAIAAIVPSDARVIGFGELHSRVDRAQVRPALAVFREDIVPPIAARLSDLVLETWIVDPGCGSAAQVATAKVEAAMKRPASTKNELAKQIEAARAAGIKVHAMKMTCADYDAVAPGKSSEVAVETMLDLVTRELGRIAQSAVAYRDKQPDSRPIVAVYGGALHNDRFPYDSVASWSYAAAVDAATGGRYVEIDLYAPELARAEALYEKEPWFPLLAEAAPDKVIVWPRGERSFLVILPTSTKPP